jgi:hypothetical protein
MSTLEEGIIVNITKEEAEKLYKHFANKGFLSLEAYPDSYKDIALPNEIGRFMLFRFLLQKGQPPGNA